jgi:(1->4)-alpha-D-glucan 1-alpha-D-glucosylmutase
MNDLDGWVSRIVESLKREIALRARPPQSTYRLQLDPHQMTFQDAARIIPYLHEFGISDLYASPYLKARSGSPHGYAIVDYGALNPQLGSADDHQAMVDVLREYGIGQILDIVPNHMSAAPGENLWWTDVLENGPSSPYASSFDIDWHPVKDELENRVLLPLLGEQYGDVLESGKLRLEYCKGAFFVRCYEVPLPLDPKTFPQILTRQLDRLRGSLPPESPELLEFQSILTAMEHLPDRNQAVPERVVERQREKEVIKKRLNQLAQSCAEVAEFIRSSVAELNGIAGDAHSFDELHRLLDAQAYRLAHWKAAGDEINYRRFFDINDLAAVCMEDPAVFEKGHRLIFEMLVRDNLAGLRIDHIDGLFDPTDYLWKLQQGYLRALGQHIFATLADPQGQAGTNAKIAASDAGPPSWADVESSVLEAILGNGRTTALPLFVVVEKILGPDEPLPKEWPVAGTTGYDFLRSVDGVLVDRGGVQDLATVFDRFVGHHTDFREVVYESKLSIVRGAMSSELQLLAQRLNRLSEKHRRFRDFTLNTLRHALREIIACFAVYRTYLHPHEVSERDRRFVCRATAQAKRRNPEIPAGAFDFVRDVLLFEQPDCLDADGCHERELFVGRFQQVTSPVMAKGVEDTACYRYFPLSSLNEVGDNPAARPVSVEEFHHENISRGNDWPGSLLCTTTHDTKRSEDVRARIAVLSEIPREWGRMINRWTRINRRHHREVDGSPAPSRGDDYLFYQTLVGVWPIEPPDEETHSSLVARLQAYMEKATREAKINTSWLNPHPEYDTAVREFVAAVLDNHPKNRFLAEFRAFHARILGFGLYNALAQALLKLMSPGVPDVYQGQELWDFSLVDPDNRRPVDFALRRRLLAELQCETERGPQARLSLARRLAENPTDPRLKLLVTWQALRIRRDHADFFRLGRYVPLAASGPKAEHVCAFAWQREVAKEPRRQLIVVVPRLISRLTQPSATANDGAAMLPCRAVWEDTRIAIENSTGMLWRNLFTGQHVRSESSAIPVADILSDFPVAVLVGGEEEA